MTIQLSLFWEIIGIFALILNIISFLEKNDNKMFIFLSICSFFYGIHYAGLGLLTASMINFIDIVKNLSVIKYKKNNFIFIILASVYIIIGYFTSKGDIISYLLTFGSVLGLFATFYFRGITLRISYLLVSLIYLIYCIKGNSISGSLTYLLFIFTLLSTIYILYKRRGFWGKIRYYKYVFHKNMMKIFKLRHKRLKF